MLKSYTWLLEHYDDSDLVILDSRSKIAYQYGHLPKSQSVTIEQVIQTDQYGSNLVADQNKISNLFGSLGIDETKIVVIVGDFIDPSSARIAWTLKYFGHNQTFLLQESFQQIQKYVKLTKVIPDISKTKFVANINSGIRIMSEQILQNSKLKLLDARSPQEFMAGHLPKAVLLPFTEGIGKNGMLFQDKDFLENMFTSYGLSKDEHLVCYCMHGHRASSLFFQLKIAGFENVKLYDGSFVEWYGKHLPLE